MTVEKFLRELQDKRYFGHHRKVLLAISSGRDSMTLFNWLYALRETFNLELGLAHVNHGVRPESAQEEAYLSHLAASRGLSFYRAAFTGKFSEKAARDFRYDFFARIMRDEGYTALLTAHHRGDQVETVLMREITGRRLRHLTGIADRQPFGPGELIRPLLSFDKAELDAPDYFEDATNQENTPLRNRVRNLLIPALTVENPHFATAIVELAQEISFAMQLIKAQIAALDILGEQVDLARFLAQPEALQHFILQEYLADRPISKAQFEQVLHILRRPGQYSAPLNSDLSLIKTAREFCIITTSSVSFDKELRLEDPHDAAFTRIQLPKDQPYQIRKRQTGDRIKVGGHSKKLRKFFIDNKISLEDRDRWLVAVDSDIYCIPGLIVSDLSKGLEFGKIGGTIWLRQWKRIGDRHE